MDGVMTVNLPYLGQIGFIFGKVWLPRRFAGLYLDPVDRSWNGHVGPIGATFQTRKTLNVLKQKRQSLTSDQICDAFASGHRQSTQ